MPEAAAQTTTPETTETPSLIGAATTSASGAQDTIAAGNGQDTAPAAPTADTIAALTAEDLTFAPETSIDAGLRDEFLAVVNDRKLAPKELANKLVDLQAKAAQLQQAKSVEVYEQLQTEWQNEVRADKDVGGDKLEGVLGGISKVVDKYGSAELRQMMDLTGVGNNLHMVRFLNKVSAVLNEPGFVPGSPAGGVQKSAAELIYDKTK
jgi:hypothetical protein